MTHAQGSPNRNLETALGKVRKAIEGLTYAELSCLLATIRQEERQGLVDAAQEAWDDVVSLVESYRELTGELLQLTPDPAALFDGRPVNAPAPVERPEAWYEHKILEFVEMFDGEGCDEKRVFDMIEFENGDPAHAVNVVLPRLRDARMLVEDRPGWWNLRINRPDAWYDEKILEFVAMHEDEGTTTKRIIDFIDFEEGCPTKTVERALPRLKADGRLVEVDYGFWKLPASVARGNGQADSPAGRASARKPAARRRRAAA